MPDLRIADIRVTPIAFADPPLLNNKGCHEPFALRSIIEAETEGGVVGLGSADAAAPGLPEWRHHSERRRGRDAQAPTGLEIRAPAILKWCGQIFD